MIDQIEILYNEMRNLTLKSGVKEENYVILANELSEGTPIEIKEMILNFLNSLKENEYKKVKDIYDLLPEEVWNRYKAFNIHGLREQILLENAMALLRKKWRYFLVKWNSKKPK